MNGPRAEDRLSWLIAFWREQATKDHEFAMKQTDPVDRAILQYVGDVRDVCADELEYVIGDEDFCARGHDGLSAVLLYRIETKG